MPTFAGICTYARGKSATLFGIYSRNDTEKIRKDHKAGCHPERSEGSFLQLLLRRPLRPEHRTDFFGAKVDRMERLEIGHVKLDDLFELSQIAFSRLQPFAREQRG